MTWDVFLSYASEDRASIARPVAEHLVRSGLRVWFDELVLKPGDRLRASIDAGVAGSDFVVVILSPAYLRKDWTRYELDGIVQRFVAREATLIPIWHEMTRDSIAAFSPTLADVFALQSAIGPESLAAAVRTRIGSSREAPHDSSILSEVFRGTLERQLDNEIDWAGLLRNLAGDGGPFRFAADAGRSEHRHGVGGWNETTYRLTDHEGNTYLALRHRAEYMTTSDDFVDYGLPSVITIEAVVPLMTPLVQAIAAKALT